MVLGVGASTSKVLDSVVFSLLLDWAGLAKSGDRESNFGHKGGVAYPTPAISTLK